MLVDSVRGVSGDAETQYGGSLYLFTVLSILWEQNSRLVRFGDLPVQCAVQSQCQKYSVTPGAANSNSLTPNVQLTSVVFELGRDGLSRWLLVVILSSLS